MKFHRTTDAVANSYRCLDSHSQGAKQHLKEARVNSMIFLTSKTVEIAKHSIAHRFSAQYHFELSIFYQTGSIGVRQIDRGILATDQVWTLCDILRNFSEKVVHFYCAKVENFGNHDIENRL
uniref:Uncharacterized protein n=1 Tax=Romanomermis culicivorax TaxID=13658 RepID=A0A915IPL9_ROMCU